MWNNRQDSILNPVSWKIFFPICCPMYFPLSLIPCACPFILSNTQIEPGYSEIQSNLVPSPDFLRASVLMSIFLGLNCLIVCVIRWLERLSSSSYSVAVLMDACLFCPQMVPNDGDFIVSAGNLLHFIILTFTKPSLQTNRKLPWTTSSLLVPLIAIVSVMNIL